MIGIFDSGCGGLTVLKAIRKRLPSVDILYFGDTKNAPYGEKTREELTRLTVNAIQFLTARGATSIVSACNSVSASLAVSLFDTLDVAPDCLIEMVGPTVSAFRTVSARVLLCATPATIRSEIYQNAFRMIGKDITVLSVPGLAGLIEQGSGAEEIQACIRTAFADISFKDFDALVLACTHYPLAANSFRAVLGTDIEIIDPAEMVADRVERNFWPREAGNGKTILTISQESLAFRAFVAQLLPGKTVEVEVIQ